MFGIAGAIVIIAVTIFAGCLLVRRGINSAGFFGVVLAGVLAGGAVAGLPRLVGIKMEAGTTTSVDIKLQEVQQVAQHVDLQTQQVQRNADEVKQIKEEVLRIERELTGRHLEPDQIKSLTTRVEQFRGQHITFEVNQNDPEALVFAFHLRDILKDGAGWEAKAQHIPVIFGSIQFGLHIASAADQRSRDAAAMLVKELSEPFLAFPSSSLREPIEEGTVHVVVGSKLPPFLSSESKRLLLNSER